MGPVHSTIDLLKGLENHFLLALRNSAASVGNFEAKALPIGLAFHGPSPEVNAPLSSKLDRIAKQIHEHLLEPFGVALPVRPDAGGHVQRQAQSLLLDSG